MCSLGRTCSDWKASWEFSWDHIPFGSCAKGLMCFNSAATREESRTFDCPRTLRLLSDPLLNERPAKLSTDAGIRICAPVGLDTWARGLIPSPITHQRTINEIAVSSQALRGHGPISDLSPLCAQLRTLLVALQLGELLDQETQSRDPIGPHGVCLEPWLPTHPLLRK
jgi:hypothetical protein